MVANETEPAGDERATTTLDRLRQGRVVTVRGVEGGDAIARRLVDLGFRPGTEVRVDRLAPLGDPIQVRLHGYRLALRRAEARRVIVTAPPR